MSGDFEPEYGPYGVDGPIRREDYTMSTFPEVPEVHASGFVQVLNQEQIAEMDLLDADFGLQVAPDGRVWVCVNGTAFVRFKPARRAKEEN